MGGRIRQERRVEDGLVRSGQAGSDGCGKMERVR